MATYYYESNDYIMIRKETEDYLADLRELDDVLEHSYFSNQEELTDMEEEFVFVGDQSEDFRSIDEL